MVCSSPWVSAAFRVHGDELYSLLGEFHYDGEHVRRRLCSSLYLGTCKWFGIRSSFLLRGGGGGVKGKAFIINL